MIEETNPAEGNLKEAKVVVKIHGSDARVALDTIAKVDVMPDRVLKKVRLTTRHIFSRSNPQRGNSWHMLVIKFLSMVLVH